jgi:hypothetical protein
MNTTINGIPLDQYTGAVELVRYLRDRSHTVKVQDAYLFGSTARGQATKHSDLDIIICVDEAAFRRWLWFVGTDIADDVYESMAYERRLAALGILGVGTTLFRESVDWPINKIDIFLFPLDWQERLDELQKLGRHCDRNFMQNICNDAVRLELTD